MYKAGGEDGRDDLNYQYKECDMSAVLPSGPGRPSSRFCVNMALWRAVVSVAAAVLGATSGAAAQIVCTGRWDTTPGMNGGLGGPYGAYAAAAMPSGDVVVGGSFGLAGGVSALNVAMYHPGTGTWSAMGAGVGGPNVEVKALCVLPDGDVIAGGDFTIPADGIVRWDHHTNQWMPMGVVGGGFRHVRALLTLPDGSVIAAGNFQSIDGVAVNAVARWTPQTGTWSGWGSAVDASIGWALALAPNGDVILNSAGGLFRLAGATNTWTRIPEGFGQVFAVTVLSDGDIVIGGLTGGSNSAPYRLDAGSGVWTQMGSAQGTLGDIVSTRDGTIYAMSTEGAWHLGSTYTALMRWNAAAGIWESMQLGIQASNPSTEIGALAVLPNGDLFCGGVFASAGGVPISNAAIWTKRPACAADFNCSTQVDVQDILDFLGAWFAGHSSADLNGDGLNAQDIFDFLATWFAGC